MKNSLLWRITPVAGSPVSYLFGTMHVRDLRAFEWLETAQRCLEHCEIFATEFEFSETDAHAVAQVMKLPAGQTLDQILKPGAWKNLAFYGRKKLNIPAEHLRFMHPLTLSLALTNALLADEAPLSLDETLYEYARGLGKKTTGVESFDEQLETLKSISFDQHVKNLSWLLKNYPRQKRRIKKMVHQYREGAIRALHKAAKKDAKGMRKVLLYSRNILMADRFVAIARERSLFCAVGAGHLAGRKGMLRLIKKEGFSIQPVLI